MQNACPNDYILYRGEKYRTYLEFELDARNIRFDLSIDVKVIGCSSLRGGGGELGTNKNLDLWLQLDCTKLKLKHAI